MLRLLVVALVVAALGLHHTVAPAGPEPGGHHGAACATCAALDAAEHDPGAALTACIAALLAGLAAPALRRGAVRLRAASAAAGASPRPAAGPRAPWPPPGGGPSPHRLCVLLR
jgi:hypothetical protein